jgi:hypothetical protein
LALKDKLACRKPLALKKWSLEDEMGEMQFAGN